MNLRFGRTVMEASRRTLFIGAPVGGGLWAELRPANAARLWSCRRGPGCLELWAGRLYVVLDRMPRRVASPSPALA